MPDDDDRMQGSDAAKAVKFLAVKAAVFILIPLLATLIAVWWRFG